MTEPFPQYADLLEAARYLGIHPQTLRRLIKLGRGPRAVMFAGKYLIHRSDLARFAQTYDPRPGRKPMRLPAKGLSYETVHGQFHL